MIALASTLLAAAAFVGCARIVEVDIIASDEVRLKASIGSSLIVSSSPAKADKNAATKAEEVVTGALNSSYNGELVIGLAKTSDVSFAEATKILKATMAPGSDNLNLRDIEFAEYQAFASDLEELRYASWYPFEGSTIADGVVTLPVDGKTDILYGSIASGTKASGFNTIQFNHALTKFRFKVYAMAETDADGNIINHPDATWGDLYDIQIGKPSTECKLTLPEAYGLTCKLGYIYSETPMSLRTVQGKSEGFYLDAWENHMSFANALELGEIMIAPPEDGNLKLSIGVKKGDAEVSYVDQSLSISGSFKPGRNYDVYLRFSDAGIINAELKVSEWVTGENITTDINSSKVYYDLSSMETANCYILSSANRSYCFDVTQMGNGPEGIIGDLPSCEFEPESVGFVWLESDLLGKLSLDSYKVVDGKALITLSGNTEDESDHSLVVEGNAVIGAYLDGELLWSWHIWVTDQPQDQSYNNGFIAMDRDLGAIDFSPVAPAGSTEKEVEAQARKTDGVYYQWGRPNPFAFGNYIYASPSEDLLAGETTEDPTGFTSQLTVEAGTEMRSYQRSKNPMTFYTERITTPYKENLWGWRSDSQEYIKSIYDPCPPGYRVPSRKLWRNIVIDEVGGHTGPHLDSDAWNHAIHFRVDSYYDVYYPVSGYFYYDSETSKIDNKGYYSTTVNQEDPGAFMWTATYNTGHVNENGTYGIPYALDYKVVNGEVESEITVTQGYDGTYAMPVRCVARRSRVNVRNLSDFQTANSYIVSEAGYYKFKADVFGNGVGQLVSPGSGTIDISEGLGDAQAAMIVKVGMLWWQGDLGGENTVPTEENFRFLDGGYLDADGYVTFQIEDGHFRKGNMILAGYDARGNIVWSWHIWMTDAPELKRSNDFEVMDRFLGATSAPAGLSSTTLPGAYDALPSLGLYYQWGRKDPFPGPSSVSPDGNSTEVFASWYKYDGTAWSEAKNTLDSYTSEGAVKTIPNSVANPMRFHSSVDVVFASGIPSTSNQYNYSISETRNSLPYQCFTTFQNPSIINSLWGYSSAAGVGRTTTKTMYDPCPPGYCVAFYTVWTNADPSVYAYYYSWLDWHCSSHSGEYVGGQPGIVLNNARFSGAFDYTWYPFTGYIDSYIDEDEDSPAHFNQVGSAGHFHTATPAGNGSRSLFYTTAVTGQIVDANYRGLPSSYAYPVRCQKE